MLGYWQLLLYRTLLVDFAQSVLLLDIFGAVFLGNGLLRLAFAFEDHFVVISIDCFDVQAENAVVLAFLTLLPLYLLDLLHVLLFVEGEMLLVA
jgi:hypothetical protein